MSKEAEKLRAQMANIRRDLSEDVEAVVENAKELTEWRNFVKRHPVLSVSAAAAIGFLLVPKRLNVMSPDARDLERLAKRNRLVVKPKAEVKRQAGMVRPVVNVVAGAVLRSCATMAGQHLGKLLNPNQAEGEPAVAVPHSSEEPI